MNTQPLNAVSGTELAVCLDIQQRQQHGIAKYAVTVADNPLALREWLQHAFEEMLDGAIYLKRAMEKLDAEMEQIKAERQNIDNVRKALVDLDLITKNPQEARAAACRLPVVADWPPLRTKG